MLVRFIFAIALIFSPMYYQPEASAEPFVDEPNGANNIGIGANIGLSGTEGQSEDSVAIFGKLAIERGFSFRPVVGIDENFNINAPITADFPIRNVVGKLQATPFIGAGIALSDDVQLEVAPLATAGVEIPLSSKTNLVGQINAAFFDKTAVGSVVGISQNF